MRMLTKTVLAGCGVATFLYIRPIFLIRISYERANKVATVSITNIGLRPMNVAIGMSYKEDTYVGWKDIPYRYSTISLFQTITFNTTLDEAVSNEQGVIWVAVKDQKTLKTYNQYQKKVIF